MTRNAPAWISIAVLCAAAVYLAATAVFHTSELDGDHASRLAGGVALLIVVCGAANFGYRPSVHIALRQTLAWLAVGLAGVIVFAYRAEVHEIGGTLLAEMFQVRLVAHNGRTAASNSDSGGGDAAISAGRGGHFFVESMINGRHVRLVADTGATLVALTAEDAVRIGLNPSKLDFAHRLRTANGVARAARVVLDEVTVGPITVRGVAASVSEPGALTENLLGMSFLSRLSSFQVRGDQLVLSR